MLQLAIISPDLSMVSALIV